MCAQVDDLKDIGSLEEYIQHSQVILFFLSCGYFRSKARSRRPECPALGILWLSTHPSLCLLYTSPSPRDPE